MDSVVRMTVIPDIHADPLRLARSLALAGADDRIGFLGDFIDAGRLVATPDDAAVLTSVRSRIDSGKALAVMGNHELNAILFHRCGPDGNPLRKRSDKNTGQHASFISAFGIATSAALDWTDWFLTLPLWQDLGGLRLVHACWNDRAIATIAARRPDGRLSPEDLPEVASKETAFAHAVNLLLTGPETLLPDGATFRDTGGHRRRHVRIAWWRSQARSWAEAALSVPNMSELPEGELTDFGGDLLYPGEAPPVLVGHYKMTGTPRIDAARAACLDYPAHPVVYQWRGEMDLSATHLAQVA